jgi:lysophospholipase L1-like esterase
LQIPGRGLKFHLALTPKTKTSMPQNHLLKLIVIRRTIARAAVLSLAWAAIMAQAQTPQTGTLQLKFSFGAKTPGYALVAPDMVYTNQSGYGFEPGAALKSVTGSDNGHAITSDKPFYFSAAVPEGNYKVTVTLGNPSAATETTVNAELRRLMLQQIHTDAGQFQTRSFIVNIRQATISTGGQVHLKDREKASEAWAWDDKMTLEFLGSNPSVSTVDIENADVPTVFVIGDSTVCDQPGEPFNSWGQMLPRFFKPVVAVANHAESGESIGSSLGAGRFNKIWSQMKKGDYLFIQYGHNDMKSKAPDALQRYTDDLGKVVEKARSLGGIPVICTPVSRRTFGADGKITNSFNGYPDAVRSVAKDKNVPLIDLQQMTAAIYEALGPDIAAKAFANPNEHTHHSDYGSYEVAKCVLMGIKQNKLELGQDIVDDFKGFDPSHPDSFDSFTLPKNPSRNARTPLGS